jgi:hypothetical protein
MGHDVLRVNVLYKCVFTVSGKRAANRILPHGFRTHQGDSKADSQGRAGTLHSANPPFASTEYLFTPLDGVRQFALKFPYRKCKPFRRPATNPALFSVFSGFYQPSVLEGG